MDVLLGLDLGTTNCKALAFDLTGRLVASAAAPTPVGPGGSPAVPEYDAAGIWQASARLIHEVVSQLGHDKRVAGVGVTSMGEAGVLVDAESSPLFPILTWHDRRTLPYTAWWRERIADSDVYRITGLPQDYIYSAHKLLWYRDQDPDRFARARSWLCLADWITFGLTGRRTTSYSMASRTMLFDLRTRDWSDELLHFTGLPASLLPPALPGGALAGTVTSRAARLTGLPEGTPVFAGGHDHICAALAAGVILPGTVLNSSGTTDTLLITLEAPLLEGPIANSGLCCGCHTARDRYYLVGGFMAGSVVGAVCRMLAGDDSPATLTALLAEAEGVPAGAGGVSFMPYLGGSGPPDRDPHAWGAWLGLRLGHTRGELVRATFEGLSLALRQLMECFEQVAGITAEELRAVGGGSRNTLWLGIKADVLGIPVAVPDVADMTARGAALLAGIGSGAYADEGQASSQTFQGAARYAPDPVRKALYEQAYRQVFREMRPLLGQLAIRPTR
jgi:xylulokinase